MLLWSNVVEVVVIEYASLICNKFPVDDISPMSKHIPIDEVIIIQNFGSVKHFVCLFLCCCRSVLTAIILLFVCFCCWLGGCSQY